MRVSTALFGVDLSGFFVNFIPAIMGRKMKVSADGCSTSDCNGRKKRRKEGVASENLQLVVEGVATKSASANIGQAMYQRRRRARGLLFELG